MAELSVPRLDFASLGQLPDVYDKARQAAQIQEARNNLSAQMRSGNTDLSLASLGLISGGDMQGGLALANLARAKAQDDWNREYQGGMLKVAQQNATRQETPAPLQILNAAGIDPKSAEGRKALFPKTDTPISATDKKAIFEAEDAQPQLQGTIEALKRAKELNSQTFQGAGAGARAWLGTKLPDMMVPDFIADPKTARATEEWQKTMGPEALQAMANTLKGATTDFELRKFIEMLADPSTTPETRGKIIDRMIALSERKQKINEARIQDLRGGTYFQPQGGQPQRNAAQPQADPLAMARDAIAKGADPNAVRQRLIQNGIDPSGL
jgi:hypothetical protein